MKKAKEYAEQYIQASDKMAILGEIVTEFFDESTELIKIRNAKSNESIVAIIRELNEKWNAFANRVNDHILENGFVELVKKRMPFMIEHLKGIGDEPKRKH